ncbi:putative pentatricopeptide repeat-containing protein At5g43820 [Arachis stenosperma]|uniref:putative pentatricopeptide repeat-containing protein At5g43820 n=1 Tax=Arachis stenosperma TaxID=217475 RepID=UPI0025AD3563|nr:putative pentatricopeptide repeat-containing protein At5g43820 [Arachis stenosperma]XP_057754260.1 putative pentatricopeptide repeat-containing protein At5g43820 [Arachis stenosperma]XP_057754267.1 putative pentatricopeptide repeat-containing protein At5g43820 [Arachis stenosperma]XP_057754272.1 putative pentatricopeptide repeat-containing protein At5g43820 [Arachis stenosperma]XP_057754279.1 putative pentatricopeptide repeat-containing protein At5g43820 [Arachis stenosperma]XP_057754289.1 
MAFRFLPLLVQCAKLRHPFPSKLGSISTSLHHLPDSFFSEELFPDRQKTISNIDEHLVLEQISDLLPVAKCASQNTILKDHESKSVREPVDGFLSPEEKLRGVFLQKLNGKAATEQALSNVGVDVNIDVLGRVVNSGNLGGEAMVTFFNWAIKQPMLPKDIGSYRVIVKALGRRKFFKFMMEVLDDMKVNGLEADLLLLSIVIDSFIRAGHVSKAIQVFSNLDDLGLRRNADALNVLLSCLCQRSHMSAASSVFNSMKGKVSFDVTTYNVVAGGWSKLGSVNEIERIMKEMEVDGFHPDCRTFSFLIEGLGRAGRTDEAVEVFNKMQEKNCPPNTETYNAMIFNFVSVRDFDESMKYYKALLSNNCEPSLDTYTRIIIGFLRARKVADALQMFDEMLRQGVVPSTGMVTSFIKHLCKYGPPYAALVIYKKARKLGCMISMNAYKILLMRLMKFAKCGMLLNIWQEMQECGYNSDIEVYECIITGLCNVGQLENAVLVMEESLQKGFCPSRLVYSKLSNRLLASNKTEIAYKLFLKIKHARSLKSARSFWRSNGWHF